MEQSQFHEIARLNEELSRVKAELKEEREKFANNQLLDDETPRVSKFEIINISDFWNTFRLFFYY